jgi:hypothetical protein
MRRARLIKTVNTFKRNDTNMSHLPMGAIVGILGIKEANRSYEDHAVCGTVLQLEFVVRLQTVQIAMAAN